MLSEYCIPPLKCRLADLFYSDIFSFYKEEISHEDTNHISLLAQLTGKSKLQCMKDLAEYSVDGRCVFHFFPRSHNLTDQQSSLPGGAFGGP
jgi:hypothetical protein